MPNSENKKPTRKNEDRETYSFMVNNKTTEGKAMIQFFNNIKEDGDKIGNYVKKLILKEMNQVSNNTQCSNLNNALLLEKLDKQEIMLKNLTSIIENQNREMSLLHSLLNNGIVIGNAPVSLESSVSSVDKTIAVDEDAEHEAFLEKAKKAVVAPDLSSVMKENDIDEDDDEDSIEFDDDDED